MSDISRDEMYRVFNMGLGMVLVCDPSRVSEVIEQIPEARVVGEITKAAGDERVIL